MSSVSIVIPAHNAEMSLASAVSSVLAQSAKVDEIIVVENGSTDSTLEIARELARRHSTVHVAQSESGVSVARNFGIKLSNSDYVGFLDADDEYRTDAIECLKYFLDKYDVEFTKGNLQHCFSDHTRIWRPNLKAFNVSSSLEVDTDYPDFVGIYCGLYRRHFLNEFEAPFPVGVHTAEDRVFVWKTLLHGARFIHVDKVVYNYDRTSETSVLKKVDGPHFDLFKAYEMIWKDRNLMSLPAAEFKFWMQYISMMEFTYRTPGRLTREGKRTWLELSRAAIGPVKDSGIYKRIYQSSDVNRRSFLAKIA